MFTHLGVASKRGIWTQVSLDPKPMLLKSLLSEAERKSVCQRITYKKVIIISLKKKKKKLSASCSLCPPRLQSSGMEAEGLAFWCPPRPAGWIQFLEGCWAEGLSYPSFPVSLSTVQLTVRQLASAKWTRERESERKQAGCCSRLGTCLNPFSCYDRVSETEQLMNS